jgi:hypothetical protein
LFIVSRINVFQKFFRETAKNAGGAICTTVIGAGTALQSREQVLQFLESYEKAYG